MAFTYISRIDAFKELFPNEPSFRIEQLKKALYDGVSDSWEDVTTLSKPQRETLAAEVPWMSSELVHLYESAHHDTYKAVLKTQDGRNFETVLMKNAREQWTICVSSQIGCAMRCTFCATGTMGLKRSMHHEEIADQYRFWKAMLKEKGKAEERISNIVFMGMGEPMANYENVKAAIDTWLTYTDLGPTKIMVSTVGVLSQMEKLLTDETWPPVQIAISLHSPNQKKREEIVPSTVPNFITELAAWSMKYQSLKGNRNHKLTAEYTLISHVNDNPEIAHELGTYIKKTAIAKINVIPYNPVMSKSFTRAERDRIDEFKEILLSYDVDVTERRTMGDDINAACGQLALANEG